MSAVKFICFTDKKESHNEIKRKLFFAGGAITREKVKDLSSGFEGELEMVCEGGTLYRELKESELAIRTTIVNN
jgi:hypothetical protein